MCVQYINKPPTHLSLLKTILLLIVQDSPAEQDGGHEGSLLDMLEEDWTNAVEDPYLVDVAQEECREVSEAWIQRVFLLLFAFSTSV